MYVISFQNNLQFQILLDVISYTLYTIQLFKKRVDGFDPYDAFHSWISLTFIANCSFPSKSVKEKNALFTKESVKIGLVVIYLKIIAGISDTSEA